MVLSIVFLFIQRMWMVWMISENDLTNLKASIVNRFLLTMLSILSLICVMLYALGWIWIRNNLVYDTVINTFVFRVDLLTNLISVLYSLTIFRKYYLSICGLCDKNFDNMLSKNEAVMSEIVTKSSRELPKI